MSHVERTIPESAIAEASRSACPSESSSAMRLRRLAFAVLITLTVIGMTALMVLTLSAGGFGLLDLVITACFVLTLPWTAVGFWNAVIGYAILRGSRDPVRAVCPVASAPDDDAPIGSSTALLVCVRNEDALTVARNLDVMITGLVDGGLADRFHAYVLSDSSWADAIAAEESELERLGDRWRGIFPVTYRRREDNPGFKAGNIRDFCERWGDRHDFALVLDADSLMSTPAILRLVRTMERNPGLGILQSLIVGIPTVSPFARVFQLGMRLGMRSYTLGSAWWQGDCGPYWGHNALIRLEPFIRYCDLPKLPGGPPLGGWILSHDQVEAVLMRRAGYEVRVLPDEGGSWEENPPTLPEFIRRDLRWCQGNMQYWRLLAMPGLKPVSRVQLLLAILMFLGSAAWIALMTLGMLRVGLSDGTTAVFDPAAGLLLLGLILTMVFAPKLATVLDVLASPGQRRVFGGAHRILPGVVTEVVFSALLAPVMALAHTKFLAGLPFGKAAVWSAQRRSTHRVSIAEAWRRLWPQTLFGAAAIVWLAIAAPAAVVGFLPFLLGALLAVPIAVVSSGERLGARLAAIGLWRIPDETTPAPELRALHLPALVDHRPRLATAEPLAGSVPGE